MTTTAAGTELTVGSFGLLDEAVRPLLDELAREYSSRYGDHFGVDALRQELERYPAHQFAAPDGDLILLLEDGVAVAGGAYRLRAEPELGDAARLTRPGTRDADGLPTVRTAEYKRIWTSAAHRRRGLSRRVLAELETRAAAAGYERLYLTTGPRQPEAAALYLATGFTPLFDTDADPEGIGPLAFEKWLCTDPPPSRPSPTSPE
ncbi:MAG: GNAT family N-acetyltransferase [Cellulomonas sp.]